jgi:hypothetical protein
MVTSGSPVVFVDDAAGDVASADLAGAWLVVAEQWGRELASAVRAGSEVKLRATWTIQAMAGLAVTPSRSTTRLSTSMTNKT